MRSSSVFLAIITVTVFQFQGVLGHGYIELKLERLENHHHKDNSGDNCDSFIQGKQCDTKLIFCLTLFTDPSLQQACNLGQFETKYYSSSTVNFHENEDLGNNLRNPLKLKFTRWEKTLELKIKAYDDDLFYDDLVDAFTTLWSKPPASNSSVAVPKHQLIRGKVSQLSFSVKVYCDDMYQSDDCSRRTT